MDNYHALSTKTTMPPLKRTIIPMLSATLLAELVEKVITSLIKHHHKIFCWWINIPPNLLKQFDSHGVDQIKTLTLWSSEQCKCWTKSCCYTLLKINPVKSTNNKTWLHGPTWRYANAEIPEIENKTDFFNCG